MGHASNKEIQSMLRDPEGFPPEQQQFVTADGKTAAQEEFAQMRMLVFGMLATVTTVALVLFAVFVL
jgi:hypothetical protein